MYICEKRGLSWTRVLRSVLCLMKVTSTCNAIDFVLLMIHGCVRCGRDKAVQTALVLRACGASSPIRSSFLCIRMMHVFFTSRCPCRSWSRKSFFSFFYICLRLVLRTYGNMITLIPFFGVWTEKYTVTCFTAVMPLVYVFSNLSSQSVAFSLRRDPLSMI